MPNIKFDLAAQQTDIIQQQQTLLHTNGPVFLFASVRKGEEHKIPGQLERLYKKCPQASVIIAPRHLHRVNAWQEILDDLGFHPVLASKLNKKRLLSPHTVLIWDQFGNLPQLYALADAVFVGGSFKEGGQNFLESLSAGRIPCIGPSADNFLWAMQSKHEPSLIQAGLIYQVHQASEVIDIMTEQLLTAPKGKQVCERFHAWLIPRCGGAAQTACLIQKKLLSLPHTFIQ
jgi:3-deoxy-D-manno-octulosonic-acid transferase